MCQSELVIAGKSGIWCKKDDFESRATRFIPKRSFPKTLHVWERILLTFR